MSQGTLLSDAMLRSLMAVGQVDVLVGVPTFNNADTIAGVLDAVHLGLAKYFPRDRTLTIASDGGSDDGTAEVARDAQSPAAAGPTLRTMHRISVPDHWQPTHTGGLRTLFAAGDLLQAKAIVIIDPAATTVTSDWIEHLATPVYRESIDFVAPVYSNHPLERPLVTQLIRPLFRATYGLRLSEPMSGDFACSGRFATHCLESQAWEGGLPSLANLWMPAHAANGGFQIAQAALGRHVASSNTRRPSLPQIVQDTMRTLFACLEAHAPYWTKTEGSRELTMRGEPQPPGDPPTIDVTSLAESFRAGVRDLRPLLEPVLASETLQALRAAAGARRKAIEFSSGLWASIVFEFIVAYRHGVMSGDHLAQALVPLYLGRTASFLKRHNGSATAAVFDDLEQVGLEFERGKPALAAAWQS